MLDRRQFLLSAPFLYPAVRMLPTDLIPGPQHVDLTESVASNAIQRNRRPLLVAVEGTDVRAMLKAGLDRLPLGENALQGKRVVIKPNATTSEPYPVTTDPVLLQGVVLYVKRAGALQITICDSSSFAGFANDQVFRKLGYFSLAKEESVKARVVDSQVGSEYVRVSSHKWRANSFVLTDRFVYEADFMINLAIPKRHHAADFSCALKNNFGCTYGTFRMLAHLRGGEFFDNALAEFADAVRPHLTIADARSVLARSGPSFRRGQSEIVTAQRLVLSGDMVAVDSYCGRLMQKVDATFDPSRHLRRQLEYAQSLGLGESDLRNTEVVEV